MSKFNQIFPEKPLQEINRYHDPHFPLGLYSVTKTSIYPEGRGYMDLHWHEELQFTYAAHGKVGLKVNGIPYMLSEGEAIFINKNALHITDFMSDDAHYLSLDVPEKLLSFFSLSRMEKDCVLPFTEDYSLGALIFRGENAWEKDFLAQLRDTLDLFLDENKPEFWEYDASIRVVKMWQLMISNICRNTSDAEHSTALRKQQRMQRMLSFIHTNYMNKILVGDIASAGLVSEAECNRCFKEMVHESPARYLLQYRYLRSRELLMSTDMSVTEIALAVGFNDTSYFIQYFKKQEGMTPKDFRKLQ